MELFQRFEDSRNGIFPRKARKNRNQPETKQTTFLAKISCYIGKVWRNLFAQLPIEEASCDVSKGLVCPELSSSPI